MVRTGCSPGYGASSSLMRATGSTCASRMRSVSWFQLPPRSHAIMVCQPSVSAGSQCSGWVRSSRNSGGSGPCRWSIHALTPSAYACRAARVCGEVCARIASALRRTPSVRRNLSVSSAEGPRISASRPATTRLFICICHSRSCAWT
ncbi:hypothetical protein D9M72_460280 [compost metagenome]